MAKRIRGIEMRRERSLSLGRGWLCNYWPKQTVWLDGEPMERIHMFYAGYTKRESKRKFKEHLLETIPNFI